VKSIIKKHEDRLVNRQPLEGLKQHTDARIAMGRVGGSIVTADWLDFKMAHAQARDAVHAAFDDAGIAESLGALEQDVLLVKSQVNSREQYLQRPDLARRLDERSAITLENNKQLYDVVFIVADGLSAAAAHMHAAKLLQQVLPLLRQHAWRIAPMVVARFARVALQDEIGALMGARIAVILLGERPGLTSPDSLAAYLVHTPHISNTDAQRNCISNIRHAGLSYQCAADTLVHLLTQAKQKGESGVVLKDDRPVV